MLLLSKIYDDSSHVPSANPINGASSQPMKKKQAHATMTRNPNWSMIKDKAMYTTWLWWLKMVSLALIRKEVGFGSTSWLTFLPPS